MYSLHTSVSTCGEGDLMASNILLIFAISLCVLLSHHVNDLLPRETLIVLSYESRDDPSITSILTELLCGVNYLCSLY
jgi:hypothetical protein